MRKSEVGWGWRVRQVTEKAVQRVSKCRAPQVRGTVSRCAGPAQNVPLSRHVPGGHSGTCDRGSGEQWIPNGSVTGGSGQWEVQLAGSWRGGDLTAREHKDVITADGVGTGGHTPSPGGTKASCR